jgi:hypothetical protein
VPHPCPLAVFLYPIEKIKEEIHLEYTLSISSSRRKLQPQKLVICGRYKTCFGGFEGLLSSRTRKFNPNEKNSGLGEERSPLYVRGYDLRD